MPLELWGATNRIGVALPDRLPGYFLLALYSLFFLYAIYLHWTAFRHLSARQWLGLLALALVAFVGSQLFPIQITFDSQLAPISQARNPVTYLTLLSAVPLLLAGVLFGPAALLVGAAGGLGQSLGQTHQLFDIFHFAFAALIAGRWLHQNYMGHYYYWLRQPAVAGVLSFGLIPLLVGLAALVSADSSASSLAALDLALSTANASFTPFLLEGLFGGLVITFLLRGAPHWQPKRIMEPSPEQRSLSTRLLNNFLRFALLLTVLLVTIVFNLSVQVSTRLVVNQMAHDADTVLEKIPEFRAQLQNLLVQYSQDGELAALPAVEREARLRQLFRTGEFYRRIVLVDENAAIASFYPRDTTAVSLTDQEITAVLETLSSSAPREAAAQSPDNEHVLSFVVPVTDAQGRPVAALVGRVPGLSLNSLIIGLQGTVGEGTGFIVDENGRIIAFPQASPDSRHPLNLWRPPLAVNDTHQPAAGVTYQGRQGETNARELVYYKTGTQHPWTVVISVPYEVVLNLAMTIGTPLALVLTIFTLLFAVNLVWLGRDITQPITELVEASKTIAAGGRLDAGGLAQRHDEIGDLSKAFVQMNQLRQQRLDELSLLLGISHDVSNSIDINQSMPIILRGAVRGTGAVGARVIVINPSGGRPLTFGEGPVSHNMAAFDRQVMRQMRHERELTLTTPEQIRDILDLPETEALPAPCLMAMTLYSQERFQGILWVAYSQANSVGTAERNLLRTLSGQASILVENARLFANAEGGRRRLAAVLASTSEAVIVTDQTERVLLINRALERVFDIKTHEVIGRPVAQVIQHEVLIQALTGDDTRARHLEIPTSDGKTYYTSASTIYNNDGQVLGRVAVLHDVTHFKEIDQMKSEFVSTVSHDLRSPLTFMRGYATMLSMAGEFSDKQHEYTNKILTGIDQMAKLVDDLLDLGRIESGSEIPIVTVELDSLLSEVAREHLQHALNNGISLQVEMDATVPTVMGDRAMLRQAVANLVINGIKYAPNSGPMYLRAEQQNGEVIISVADNGPGIPQQEQMRLFEKFYRARQRGTENVKGSGLGLAIVKSVAERHGGRVWCRSETGMGSTFYLSLPLEREAGKGQKQETVT
jgi:PAS domain S-box-containing protein